LVGMIKTAIGRGLQDLMGQGRIDLIPAASAVHDILAPLNTARVVTAFIGILDVPGRTLHYLNAGHPPAALWKPGTSPRLRPAARGRPDAPARRIGDGGSYSPERVISFRSPVLGLPRRTRWLFVSAMTTVSPSTARPPGSWRVPGSPSPKSVFVSIEPKAIPLILLLYESAT